MTTITKTIQTRIIDTIDIKFELSEFDAIDDKDTIELFAIGQEFKINDGEEDIAFG